MNMIQIQIQIQFTIHDKIKDLEKKWEDLRAWKRKAEQSHGEKPRLQLNGV